MIKYLGGSKIAKTYLEFITKNGIHKIELLDNEKIHHILKKNIGKVNDLVCLDFHGVADLYDLKEKIPSTLPKIIISWVGEKEEVRLNTIKTIQLRVNNNEILLGILVYTKNYLPTCGTKGWVIARIIGLNPNIRIHFIDDSKKNIICVSNTSASNITTYLIDKKNNPRNQVDKILTTL